VRATGYTDTTCMALAPEHPHHALEHLSSQRQHVLKLFIASFEHSQGFQRLQTDIFEYLHHHNPALHLADADEGWLTEQALVIINHLIVPDVGWQAPTPFPHVFTQELAVIKTVVPVAEVYRRILNSTSELSLEVLMPRLTKQLIARDYGFLVANQGRKARRQDANTLPTRSRFNDPYFSYICAYALQHRSTGLKELDAMYGEVARHCQTIFAERETIPFVSKVTRKLEAIVNTYNRHHPDRRIGLVGVG